MGFDTNGDGSAANDRPSLSNPRAPFSSVGIDGALLDPTLQPGTVYFDVAALNQTGDAVPVAPGNVHFLFQWVPGTSGETATTSRECSSGICRSRKIFLLHSRIWKAQAFQIRAEAQDVGNHNNVEPMDTNVLNAGVSSFLNPSQFRSNVNNGALAQGRVMRFWAKFNF